MGKLDEIVYAVKKSDLEPLFQGFITPPDKDILNTIYTKYVLMARRDIEDDQTFKHVIPYTILIDELNRIFVVKRSKNQTEKRLVHSYSIGIGGHVGPQRYMNTKDSIHMGMLRELKEEVTGMDYVGESFDFTPKLMGMVNSNDDVGLVHFGLVYELLVDPDHTYSITVKEVENMEGSWMPFEEALKIKGYELWSQYILDELSKR